VVCTAQPVCGKAAHVAYSKHLSTLIRFFL